MYVLGLKMKKTRNDKDKKSGKLTPILGTELIIEHGGGWGGGVC